MATKGFNKLITKVKAILGSNTSGAAPDSQEQLNASIERQKELKCKLASLLVDIEYSPEFKLSKDKIQEFNIPVRIARFIKALDTPLITETDEEILYHYIASFVDALRKALRLGYENSAYWSSLALHHSLECLHVPVDEYDKEFSEMLYQRKLEYAETLNIIIRNANKQDELDAIISADKEEYKLWVDERNELQNYYDALKTHQEGIDLINRTRNHVSSPIDMAADEHELFVKLRRAHELDKLIANMATMIDVHMETYRNAVFNIQQSNSKLRYKPSVHDEKLDGKIAVINERFQEHLRNNS